MADDTVEEAVVIASKEPKFSATKFINNIRPTRRVHFTVDIMLPPVIMEKYDANKLTLTAVSTNIPNIGIENTSVRRGTVSYKESFPTNITFGDLSITFYSDMEGQTLSIFKDWIDYIFPTSVANDEIFSVPYKSDYAATMYIKHYDPEGRLVVEFKFDEVFPATIADIPFNWGAFNDVVTLSADFKYTTYSVKNFDNTGTAGSQQYQKDTGVLSSLSQNSLLPIISTIKNVIQKIF